VIVLVGGLQGTGTSTLADEALGYLA